MSEPEKLPDPKNRNGVWRFIQFLFQIFCTLWIRVRVKGMDRLPEGGALILANHQSFLDPLLIGVWLHRPVSYLARESLFRIPVIGWILKSTYVMAIRRESAGTESLRKSIARLEHGFYVGLFPEGTRTKDGLLGNIKPGFIAVARRTQAPIVPVGVAGAYNAMPRRSFLIWPIKIRVVFGEPISAETVAEFSQKGREKEFVKLIHDRLIDSHRQAEEWRTGRDPYSFSSLSAED